MGYRKFTDADGNYWEIHNRHKSQWDFVPLEGNNESLKSFRPPGYQPDVYELSQEELQGLFDSAVAEPPRKRQPNPFGD